MTSPEAMDLDQPDFDGDGHCGADCSTTVPCHRVGSPLFPSGHVAQTVAGAHAGRRGADLTVDQGHAAARQTGIDMPGGIRQAVGLLDRVGGIGGITPAQKLKMAA